MPNNDINELDEQDVGLKGIFGNRFHDATSGAERSKKEYTSEPVKTEQSGTHKRTKQARDAEWEPVEEVTFLTRLEQCVKKVAVFAVLNLLIFYWQQKGLMAESVALPCMIVCAVLFGWGAAKLGGNR